MWASLYPKYYSTQRLTKALKWAGQNATDCSGLISWYTGKVRSSSSYMANATSSGAIDTIPEMVGLLVWKQGHIGVYVGNGKVIEAKGFDSGVVMTNLKDTAWTKWLKCSDITYIEYVPASPITKKSSKEDVKWLQSKLNTNDYKLTIDGIYGPKTAGAVKDYYKKYLNKITNGYTVRRNAINRLKKSCMMHSESLPIRSTRMGSPE